LSVENSKVSLLPAMANPANISHTSNFVLVSGIWFDPVDLSDYSFNNWQGILIKLLLGVNQKSFVVNKT